MDNKKNAFAAAGQQKELILFKGCDDKLISFLKDDPVFVNAVKNLCEETSSLPQDSEGTPYFNIVLIPDKSSSELVSGELSIELHSSLFSCDYGPDGAAQMSLLQTKLQRLADWRVKSYGVSVEERKKLAVEYAMERSFQ